MVADKDKSLPTLSSSRKYADFQLDDEEWEIISLAHQALAISLQIYPQLPANAHSELSAEKTLTCQRVYPVIEQLQSQWEALTIDLKFDLVLPALEAGLKNMKKWYRATERTSIYFVFLDPGRKLTYLSIAWEDRWIKKSMKRMSEIFLKYKAKLSTLVKQNNAPAMAEPKGQPLTTTDSWIDELIRKNSASVPSEPTSPTAELEEFMYSKPVNRALCEDIIAWWGIHQDEYPVLSAMACDYLAVPGSSTSLECAFSYAERTDSDPRRRNLGAEKFGTLQRLKGAYRDGCVSAQNEAWMDIGPCFDEADWDFSM
ncbi:uncharacterized protein ARMOST_12524 [Armillaria ostoyae]|uniref:HAT C-terminal dimerisation domain-containing protein n=1 Tax=Armillaria ostoyae TaxID=47428 RepID=A0A284RK59_ARMOS|nr:uncharacterized protein ARMOST_12524 [Armillaria ostoyae]